MNLKIFKITLIYICVGEGNTIFTVNVWKSETTYGSLFSPSTMWGVLVIELRLSGLVADALISLALKCEV